MRESCEFTNPSNGKPCVHSYNHGGSDCPHMDADRNFWRHDVAEAKSVTDSKVKPTLAIDHFANDVLQALRSGLVKSIEQQATSLIQLPPYNQRPTLPADIVQQVYALIDTDRVLESLRAEINERVATMICQNMLEELKSDVKKVLSHEPTRLRLRMVVAGEIDKIKVEDWREKYVDSK